MLGYANNAGCRGLRIGLVIEIVITLSLLCACASPLAPGISREADVIAYFGKPVDLRQLNNGEREFDYPRGPLGRETWRVTLSAKGTVINIAQLLDEPYFARLKKGMSMVEVNRELGRHFVTTEYSDLAEQVWSWRYHELGSRLMFFNAHFDTQTGLLKYTSKTPEFVSERRGRGGR